MAGAIGKVRPHGRGFRIDFGRRWKPRFLYSFRGSPFTDRHLADAILGWVELEHAKGRQLSDILSEAAPNASGSNSVSRLLQEWLAHFRQQVRAGDRAPRTLREYERWAAPAGHFTWWADRSIWEVDTGTLEDWSFWLADRGLSPKSRWNVMAGFAAFLTYVAKRRKAFERPEIPWPEKERKLPEVLDRETQAAVLEAIPWGKRGIFIALADAGIRPNEARVLEVRNWVKDDLRVELAAKDRLTRGVRRGRKNNVQRVAPISMRLLEWLEAEVPAARRLNDPTGPLFKNPDPQSETGWFSETAMRRIWYFACDRAGIPRIGLYRGTKHSTGTALKKAGADDRVLAQFFGHEDSRSVEVYAAVDTEMVRGELRKLERRS